MGSLPVIAWRSSPSITSATNRARWHCGSHSSRSCAPASCRRRSPPCHYARTRWGTIDTCGPEDGTGGWRHRLRRSMSRNTLVLVVAGILLVAVWEALSLAGDINSSTGGLDPCPTRPVLACRGWRSRPAVLIAAAHHRGHGPPDRDGPLAIRPALKPLPRLGPVRHPVRPCRTPGQWRGDTRARPRRERPAAARS